MSQTLFFFSLFLPLSFLLCGILIFPSSIFFCSFYCFLFSSLLSLLLIVSSPLTLHSSFFLFSSLLPLSYSIVSNLLNFSSHLRLFPLLFTWTSGLLPSSVLLFSSPLFSLLPSFSHLISSHVSLQFSPLIPILSLLHFIASKISATIPKQSVSLIRSQSSLCSSSPFYSSINLLHIVFYLNQPLISNE